jgi:hypothetical protein
MLFAVLGMFENQTSLIANGTFTEEDGEVVLTIPGGNSEVRLLPGKNGNAVDSTGSGVIREREALRTLAANGWIDARVEGTTLKIRLGEHAKKIRKGTAEPQEPVDNADVPETPLADDLALPLESRLTMSSRSRALWR